MWLHHSKGCVVLYQYVISVLGIVSGLTNIGKISMLATDMICREGGRERQRSPLG